MHIEPIGVFFIVIGFICAIGTPRFSYFLLVITTVLGSAAAITLGSATVQPAHFLIIFLAIVVMADRTVLINMLDTLTFPNPGFWLLGAILYGTVGAVFFSRIFAGQFNVVAVGVSSDFEAGSILPLTLAPLTPVSGNITQPLYLLGDCVCFLIIAAKIQKDQSGNSLSLAILTYCTLDIFFAIVDIITYSTHSAWLMDFMRNAQYGIQVETELAGLKRIAGAFTEASAFSTATLGVFGYSLTLWISNIRPKWSGTIAAISLPLLVFSTSSTALVGTPIMALVVAYQAFWRTGVSRRCLNASILVSLLPMALLASLALTLILPGASSSISDYFDQLIFQKANTQSGIERGTWNASALNAFEQSYGLGVGLGTVRASSFITAILSNLGIPGCAFFALFLITTLGKKKAGKWCYEADLQRAGRNGALGILVGACVSGTLVDLGLMFFVFAATSYGALPGKTSTHNTLHNFSNHPVRR